MCPLTRFARSPKRTEPDGWAAAAGDGRGKSGLHGKTVPANGRRGRPQGKCHRKQTARARPRSRARVKRCGKSAPRPWQQGRQGKPHREQDRIGAAGGVGDHGREAFPARRPGWSREARSDARPRRMAAQHPRGCGQNPAYRPSGIFRSRVACGAVFERATDLRRRVCRRRRRVRSAPSRDRCRTCRAALGRGGR